jgi:hypothetical protein
MVYGGALLSSRCKSFGLRTFAPVTDACLCYFRGTSEASFASLNQLGTCRLINLPNTVLGEWGNFIVFKYFCSARSEKMESRDVTYACMCRVVREGGFRIAFMARLSA